MLDWVRLIDRSRLGWQKVCLVIILLFQLGNSKDNITHVIVACSSMIRATCDVDMASDKAQS